MLTEEMLYALIAWRLLEAHQTEFAQWLTGQMSDVEPFMRALHTQQRELHVLAGPAG